MKKNPTKTAQTHAALREAFWKLYAKKPFGEITVREIAQRAGYNRSTFYMYYRDVRDVLEETEDEIFETLQDRMRFASDPFDSEQFESKMHYFVSFFEHYRPYLPLLLGDRGDQKFSQRLWEKLREEIRFSLSQYSTLDPRTFDYVAEYILSAQAGLLLRWFHNDCDIPLKDIVRLTRELMHNGAVYMLREKGVPTDVPTEYCEKR